MGNHFPKFRIACFILGISAALLAACTAPQVTEEVLSVTVTVDGDEVSVDIPAGSTVDGALRAAGIILGTLDRIDPPLYTVLNARVKHTGCQGCGGIHNRTRNHPI